MSLELSPAKKRRFAQARRREVQRWKARNGPVTVRYVDPSILKQDGAHRSAPTKVK